MKRSRERQRAECERESEGAERDIEGQRDQKERCRGITMREMERVG